MFLTREEKDNIISNFPYKYITHDRVLYKNYTPDMYIIVPSGIKCCIWISMYNNQPILYELYLTNACKIYDVTCHFFVGDMLLARGKGTICSGYSFFSNNKRRIVLIDIMSLNGISLVNDGFNKRMMSMYSFFESIDLLSTRNTFTIGFANTSFNEEDIFDIISKLKFKVSYVLKCKIHNNAIQYISKDRVQNYNAMVFKVKALESNDIYELYCRDMKTSYSIAGIQTLETSVMMNKIFRNIRENDNLDLLEESEDECDTYLLDGIEKNMLCSYNNKMNKWIPIKIVDAIPDDIVTVTKIEGSS